MTTADLKRAGWLITMAAAVVPAAIAQHAAIPMLREGSHRFNLQWITDSPKDAGTVEITKADGGVYSVKGEQRKGTDGLASIDGTLKVISAHELLFTGEIQTQCNYIYQGRVCDRKGTFHFFARGARQFWRLQEMNGCDGESVDYVDIYF